MRVVVLAELPRTRETLLLRLLGSGGRLAEALSDLEALPAGAWERTIATPILVHFGLTARDELQTNEEDNVSAEIRAWYEDYKRQQEEERNRARDEGRAEEAARNLLTVLRVRGVAVPDVARERILAEKDPARLERWLEKAAVATSVADVLDEPS